MLDEDLGLSGAKLQYVSISMGPYNFLVLVIMRTRVISKTIRYIVLTTSAHMDFVCK